MTRAGQTDSAHVPRQQCPCTLPHGLVPHSFFLRNPAHSIARIPDQGFGERRIGKGGHEFSQGMRSKASSGTRARLRHHLFHKGLCHPPAAHASLPGARAKLTVHLAQGRHRASQQAPSLSAGADRDTQAQPAPAGSSTFLHAATAPHYL